MLIQSPTKGHLICFYLWHIADEVARNITEPVSSMSKFSFLPEKQKDNRDQKSVSKSRYIHTLINKLDESQLLHKVTNLGFVSLFNFSHPGGCVAVSHCSFDMHLSDD